MIRKLAFCSLLFLVLSVPALGRVLSYAPLSDKTAVPAVQDRANRHFVLIEFSFQPPPPILAPPEYGWNGYQLVLYDSRGESEPKVVLPREGNANYIGATAVWEGNGAVPRILTHTDVSIAGDNPERKMRLLYSADGGETWKAVLSGNLPYVESLPDTGGPIARGRGAAIRPASAEYPFIVTLDRENSALELVAIRADGTPKTLAWFGGSSIASPPIGFPYPYYGFSAIVGANREGTEFLVVGSLLFPDHQLGNAVRVIDLEGTMRDVLLLPSGNPGLDGWIAPDDTVYLDSRGFGGPHTLLTYRAGQKLDTIPLAAQSFAVPTHDFAGAWIVQRGTGQPTAFLKHTPGAAPVEQWRDTSGPEVEAIHSSRSGDRLLIQVHRPRPQTDDRLFIDPGLAVWNLGDPAPPSYDELFLNEGYLKGFVSLDVDRVALGGSFVFDSAMTSGGIIGPPISPAPPGGGGGDVTQEWGVVRSSLRQRLVIPSVARAPGAFESQWRTDIVLHNPSGQPLNVGLTFVPSGVNVAHGTTRTVQLNAYETRLLPDFVLNVLQLETAWGALFLDPELGTAITATSRTYSEANGGTFGMGMPAIDVHATASPRFSQTFAGAFQGTDFRTNLLVTDTSGRGANARFEATSTAGKTGEFLIELRAPAGGQIQVNDIASWMQFPFTDPGALTFRPIEGEAIATVVAIDNRTNDPSYFTADLAAQFTRVIPAIAHAPGAYGAQFRSDLFLFNPTARDISIVLAAKRWDVAEGESMATLLIKSGEARIIRDAFFTLFGKTGVGRLRFLSSGGMENSVRMTSRLYTIDETGATYGLVMPPINSFQSAGEGEAVEILGARGGAQFRTNLALVELSPFANQALPARVKVEIFGPAGELMDAFETSVPGAGGIQLVDIFRNRGLGEGPEVSLFRVSVFKGRVAAFASNLDNVTNDSILLSAVLASQEQP